MKQILLAACLLIAFVTLGLVGLVVGVAVSPVATFLLAKG